MDHNEYLNDEKITPPPAANPTPDIKLPWFINLILAVGGFLLLEVVTLVVGNVLVTAAVRNGLDATAYSKSVPFLSDLNFFRYLFTFLLLTMVIVKQMRPLLKLFTIKKTWIRGLSYGALAIAASVAIGMVINLIYDPASGGNDNQQAVVAIIKHAPFLSLLWIPFIGPIVEELIYRLGLFDGLRKFNRPLAYVLTSLIFAFIHFNFQATDIVHELISLPPYIVAGLIFGYAYDKDGPAASIIAHVVNNLASTILTIISMFI